MHDEIGHDGGTVNQSISSHISHDRRRKAARFDSMFHSTLDRSKKNNGNMFIDVFLAFMVEF